MRECSDEDGHFTEETDKTITLKDRRISMSDKVEHDRDLLAAYKMLYLRKGSAKLKDYDFEKMRADYPDFCKREQKFNEK